MRTLGAMALAAATHWSTVIVNGWFTVENSLETDPLIPLLIDPHFSFYSSKNKMQADEMKNRSSLHSI
jgi:hypothetical protein